MKLNKQRLDRLEAEVRALVEMPGLPPGFDADDELVRWGRVLDPVAGLLGGDEESLARLIDFVRDRWLGVLRASTTEVNIHPQTRQWAIQGLPDTRRIPAAVLHLMRKLPTVELRRAAVRAMPSETGVNRHGPPWWGRHWVFEVAHLWGRLPPDIDPALVGRFAELYETRDADIPSETTCFQCGLARPRHRAWAEAGWSWRPGRPKPGGLESFDGRGDYECPHCHADQGDGPADEYEGPPRGRKPAWRDLAERELAAVAEEFET
jgi:hypothetical protein